MTGGGNHLAIGRGDAPCGVEVGDGGLHCGRDDDGTVDDFCPKHFGQVVVEDVASSGEERIEGEGLAVGKLECLQVTAAMERARDGLPSQSLQKNMLCPKQARTPLIFGGR